MYSLDSGIELHNEAPDTFWITSKKRKQNLKENDTVKVVFREKGNAVERMWVKVTKVIRNKELLYFEGKLENQPYHLQSIKYEDFVEFNEDHIIDIY